MQAGNTEYGITYLDVFKQSRVAPHKSSLKAAALVYKVSTSHELPDCHHEVYNLLCFEYNIKNDAG